MAQETFGEWLDKEIRSRGWSRREFSERTAVSGRKALSNAAVDKYVSGEIRQPSPAACRGIAKALGVSFDEVASRAGHFVNAGELTPRLRALARRLMLLPLDERDAALDALETAVRAAEKRHPAGDADAAG